MRDERYEVTPGITSGSCSSQKLDPVIAASTPSQRQGASLGQGGSGPGACTGFAAGASRTGDATQGGCAMGSGRAQGEPAGLAGVMPTPQTSVLALAGAVQWDVVGRREDWKD